jgi:hypothetical protein
VKQRPVSRYFQCVRAKLPEVEAAHIYPFFGTTAKNQEQTDIFWTVPNTFLPAKKVKVWKKTIFPDLHHLKCGREECYNFITLT